MTGSGIADFNKKIKLGSTAILLIICCAAAGLIAGVNFLKLILPNGTAASPLALLLYTATAIWFLRTRLSAEFASGFTKFLSALLLSAAVVSLLVRFTSAVPPAVGDFFSLTLPEIFAFFTFGLSLSYLSKIATFPVKVIRFFLLLLSFAAAAGVITCVLQTVGEQTYYLGRTSFVSWICMRLVTHFFGFYLDPDDSVLLYNKKSAGGNLVGKLAPFIVLVTTAASFILLCVIEYGSVSVNFAILCFTVVGILGSLLYVLFLGQNEDVKALKRETLQRELEISERKFKYFERALNTGAMVTITDQDFIYTYVNDAFCEATGYRREELLGKEILTLQRTKNPEAVKSYILDKVLNRSMYKTEAKIWLKSGGFRYVNLTVVTFQPDDTGKQKTLNVYFDIHENKLKERELTAQYSALKAKNRETEEFAYLVSHDLQEPLRTIVNFSEILREENADKLDDEGRVLLDFISKAAGRMNHSVKGLLDFSRLGREKTVSRIDTNQTLAAVRSDLQEFIKKKNATVTSENLPFIKGYATEFRLLLQNLIHNAVKFSAKNAEPLVRVTARETKENYVFCVSDNGVGIKPEYIEKVFVIFQRAHQNKEYDGTGIGLSHCSKIVDLHGGRIWVESEEGEGSRFFFTIPV